MDLTRLKDDLGGDWWHYLRSKDFSFLEKIPNLNDISVEEGDFLIHKQIKAEERFPTIRYHLIKNEDSVVIENKELKERLANNLVEFIKTNGSLPFACKLKKLFKNGSAQVDYTPTRYDNFSLKINPKEHGIANVGEFLEGLTSNKNELETIPSEDSRSIPQEVWEMASKSDPNKIYKVTKNLDGSFSCTCPHHVFRKAECKHIKEVKKSNG